MMSVDLLTTLAVLDVFLLIFAGYIASKLSTDIIKQREIVIFRHLIGAFMLYVITSSLWTLQEYGGIDMPRPLFYAVCLLALYSVSVNAYMFYGFTMLRIVPEATEKRWFRLLSQAPIALIPASLAVNFFNGQVFVVTPDKHIVYGPWYPLMPWLSSLYLGAIFVLSLAMALRSRTRAGRKQHMTMALSMVFIFICVLIDDRLQNVTILPLAIFAAIFFVFINIQESSIYSDALTGMNNRRKAGEYLTAQMDSVSPEDPMLLYMADLNGFKQINDEYGHGEGDRALVLFADAVKVAVARYQGFAARYGGDEFILAVRPSEAGMPGLDPEEPVREIQALLARACKAEEKPYAVSICAGYALCQDPREPLENCVKRADDMLYVRKADFHRRDRAA